MVMEMHYVQLKFLPYTTGSKKTRLTSPSGADLMVQALD